MKKLCLVALVAAIVLVRTARAQEEAALPAPIGLLDHLICYTMKDPLQLGTSADLIAQLQPDFSQKGCVLTAPVEFCVPASKANVVPPPQNPQIVGRPLQNDYVCYTADCPAQVLPPDKVVEDQFGRRTERDYLPAKVCVPARKSPKTCSSTGVGLCGGICLDKNNTCQFTSGRCVCAPAPCGGTPDQRGVCGGQCTASTERCLPDANGNCSCQPPPPPPCGITAAGCGGTCPNPGDRCVVTLTGDCSCKPITPVCGRNAAGQCGGACPNPTDKCMPVTGTTACSCQPPPCGQDPLTGQCGGACPNAGQCLLDSSNRCTCQPPPCGPNPLTGTCGGACPTATQVCVLTNPPGYSCRCATLPTACGFIAGSNVCGGPCPSGKTCKLIAGAAPTCGCQ